MENLPATTTEPAQLPDVVSDDDLFLSQFQQDRLPIVASWPLDNSYGRAMVMRCFDNPDLDLASVAGKEIEVIGLAILRAPGKTGVEGEVTDKWKACLVDKNEVILRFASPSALDSLRRIVTLLGGMRNLRFPIKLRVISRKGEAPGPYYLLELVEEESP